MDCERGESVECHGRANGMGPGSVGAALGMGGVVPCQTGRDVTAQQKRGRSAAFESTRLSHGDVSLPRVFSVFLEGVARLSFTAYNILTYPTPSAPRRARVPGEHILIVRGLRARRMVWLPPRPALRVKKPRAIVPCSLRGIDCMDSHSTYHEDQNA